MRAGFNDSLPTAGQSWRSCGEGPVVSVVIVSWNRAALLRCCLQSVYASQGDVTYEVIVVDNASSDESAKMVSDEFPEARLIVNTQNRGFGPGANQGFTVARGRYTLLLNNDATVSETTIRALASLMDRQPRVGICSCRGYRDGKSLEVTGGAMDHLPTVGRQLVVGLSELLRPPLGILGAPIERLCRRFAGWSIENDELEAPWVKGSLLMLRRDMLSAIGGFDERFFMFFEETDLCIRARQSGWSTWYTPSTFYFHVGRASTDLRGDRNRLYRRSGYLFFQKYHGHFSAAMFWMQHLIVREALLAARQVIGAAARHVWRAGAARSRSGDKA